MTRCIIDPGYYVFKEESWRRKVSHLATCLFLNFHMVQLDKMVLLRI